MIDQDHRNFRIRELAERILFAGINSRFFDSDTIVVADIFEFAREMIDYGIKNYSIAEDLLDADEDEECQTP